MLRRETSVWSPDRSCRQLVERGRTQTSTYWALFTRRKKIKLLSGWLKQRLGLIRSMATTRFLKGRGSTLSSDALMAIARRYHLPDATVSDVARTINFLRPSDILTKGELARRVHMDADRCALKL